MARKLTAKKEHLNEILKKLSPSFTGCYDPKFLADAQVKKSPARNALFGSIINAKFIVLKVDKDNPTPPLYALTDIYTKDSAQNIASLLIYRLGHNGVIKAPTPYIAE